MCLVFLIYMYVPATMKCFLNKTCYLQSYNDTSDTKNKKICMNRMLPCSRSFSVLHLVIYQLQPRISTRDMWQSKKLILSTNADQKWSETEFLIVICRPTVDKWQLKTLFLAIFDPHPSIFKSVFDCRLSSVISQSQEMQLFYTEDNTQKNCK